MSAAESLYFHVECILRLRENTFIRVLRKADLHLTKK